jgi:xylulokinase
MSTPHLPDGPVAGPGAVLTFDCGTASLKALVVGPGGTILAEATAVYPLYQPEDGHAEQSGDEIWDAVVAAGHHAVTAAAAPVDAVVFAATWKALLPIDAEGRPLSRALIWMDSRGREQAERLNARLGRFVGTGQEYWPRAMWLKEHRPDVWREAAHVVGLNTYLKLRATGVVVTEPSDDFVHGSDEASTAAFTEILRAAGLDDDRAKFAPSLPATARIGGLTADAAAQLGLEAGVDVYNGFGDLPAVTVGTGCARPGTAHIYLGSSSWLVHATTTPPATAPLTFTLQAGLYGASYVVQSGCLAYDWIVRELYRSESAELGDDVNTLVNREVAQVEAGSDNLLATHWINGELPPLSKNAKGVFLNLTARHDRRHMVRAMMESICYAHRSSYERFLADGGTPLESIRVVGGGATSDVWMQMLSDVLGLPVEVPVNPRHTGALGAYYACQVGRGELSGLTSLEAAVEIERRFVPAPQDAAVYDRLFPIHDQLHRSLHPVFTLLNGDY